MRRVTLTFVSSVILISCTLAADRNPPIWRGNADTTFERWEFSTAANPAPPPTYNNPNGLPLAFVQNGVWSAIADNRVGVWTLATNGLMTLDVPNYPPPNERKELWLQLTWEWPLGAPPTVTVSGKSGQLIEDDPLQVGSPWHHTTYSWTLYPNPPLETVLIFGPTKIDEVVLDTWCIPEPSGAMLLAMGGGLWAVRRSKRSQR